jgi:methylated-DNA--[protein]-cysteine S-methyltransferase
MVKKMDNRFVYEVLEVVGEIPRGKVATYGQIASLVGRPKNARLVGKILSQVDLFGDYPCHRVVNASGRLVPGWLEQKELLETEGILFKSPTNVSLREYQWNPEED